MATIKITDESQGRTFRTGVNGKMFDLPVGEEVNVDDALVDHLEGLGVSFDECEGSSKGARASKEGSEDELAPTGPHDVRFPGTRVKSVDNSGGDQPGDVTAGGVGMGGGGSHGSSIKEDAEISDIRVAAERMTTERDAVAKRMGEGEQGTDTPDTQGVEPTHKDESDSKSKSSKSKK